ncbi:MAG: hypothetical protein WC436_00655 [Candidatus Babeliales bacterium]
MKRYLKKLFIYLFLFSLFKPAFFMDIEEQGSRKHARAQDEDYTENKRLNLIKSDPQNRFDVEKTGILNLSNLNINNVQFFEILQKIPINFLEKLDLTSCIHISRAGLEFLKYCPNLVGINLAYCNQLTGEDIMVLANCKKLETLNIYIYQSKLSPTIYESIEYLKQQLPNLKITSFYADNFFYSPYNL